MKKFFFLIIMLIAGKANPQNLSPRQLYPGLFEQVEMARLFGDSKTFPDAILKEKPQLIEQDYLKHKNDANFNLKAFVDGHFNIYRPSTQTYVSNIKAGVRKHIDTLWQVLSRKSDVSNGSSLIPLPHPYVVPGGRFGEVYYWDSYFTMLGLQQVGKTGQVQNIVENFAYLINHFGFIPNGNRTYCLTRSQPPFFCMMVELLARNKGNITMLKYKPELLAEYNFWMKGTVTLAKGSAAHNAVRLTDGTILNRYWDESDQPREESYREDVSSAAKLTGQKPTEFYRNIRAAAESGWDFSSRWFADGKHLTTINTTDIVPVDLNALLYHLETTLAKCYMLKGAKDSAAIYQTKAGRRKQALIKYCWNGTKGWFMDYNWLTRKQTDVKSMAGAVPLFFGMATLQQAEKISRTLRSTFLQPGGLVTTLNKTGQQWDWPNAWAPLQFMAIEGLEEYHQHTLADTIARRWIKLNTAVFNQTGKLLEKYNVTDLHTKAGGGEYPLQDGFGWTNGVLLTLMAQYR